MNLNFLYKILLGFGCDIDRTENSIFVNDRYEIKNHVLGFTFSDYETGWENDNIPFKALEIQVMMGLI